MDAAKLEGRAPGNVRVIADRISAMMPVYRCSHARRSSQPFRDLRMTCPSPK
jgi:hypothetical protein